MDPEEKAREHIDQLLADAGWCAQNREELDLGAALGVAVREFPLKSAFADYLLFVDRKAAGAIEAFLRRQVLPYAPDAWYVESDIKIGYEVSFTRFFYKPQPMRSLDEIRADILALKGETDGLLGEIIGRKKGG